MASSGNLLQSIATCMSQAGLDGYTGVLYLYHCTSTQVIVQWTGSGISRKDKVNAEQYLLDLAVTADCDTVVTKSEQSVAQNDYRAAAIRSPDRTVTTSSLNRTVAPPALDYERRKIKSNPVRSCRSSADAKKREHIELPDDTEAESDNAISDGTEPGADYSNAVRDWTEPKLESYGTVANRTDAAADNVVWLSDITERELDLPAENLITPETFVEMTNGDLGLFNQMFDGVEINIRMKRDAPLRNQTVASTSPLSVPCIDSNTTSCVDMGAPLPKHHYLGGQSLTVGKNWANVGEPQFRKQFGLEQKSSGPAFPAVQSFTEGKNWANMSEPQLHKQFGFGEQKLSRLAFPAVQSLAGSMELANTVEPRRKKFCLGVQKQRRPSFPEVQSFINSLNLQPETFLEHRIGSKELEQLRILPYNERMPDKWRRRLQTLYSEKVHHLWMDAFGHPHVNPDVIEHTAREIVKHFPSLQDKDPQSLAPHSWLFIRYPKSGRLYDCFKNLNRGLPSEHRLRRPKRKAPATTTTSAVLTDVNLPITAKTEAVQHDMRIGTLPANDNVI